MAISKIVQNSISDTVQLGRDFVFKPTITAPANNTTNVLYNQLITATSYLSLYGVAQANALFQISTSPTFAFINVASTITGSNTQFQANANSGLVASTTTHYARVRYSDTSNNSSAFSDTVEFTTVSFFPVLVDFLVVAGGGGSGFAETSDPAGGGGAGGYRSSVSGESSGGGASAEPTLALVANTNYTVTVGAGGVGGTIPNGQFAGGNSVFGTITSLGGGGGGNGSGIGNASTTRNGRSGGSGGGGGYASGTGSGGAGTSEQGYAGGTFSSTQGGGGGGAGAAGTASLTGGAGVASSITGSPVTRAAGGNGSNSSSGSSSVGTVNTGNGAKAGWNSGSAAGGSGIVILKYPNNFTISNPGGGLTLSTATAGGFSVTTVTAGTGTVSFA